MTNKQLEQFKQLKGATGKSRKKSKSKRMSNSDSDSGVM